MNLENIKKITTMSAGKYHLIAGLIGLFGAIGIEIGAIYNLVKEVNASSIALIFILQFAVGLCLLISTVLRDYKNKKEFDLLLCKMEDVYDFAFLKANYHILEINENYVLFCRLADSYLGDTWKFHYYDTNAIEKMFKTSKLIYEY